MDPFIGIVCVFAGCIRLYSIWQRGRDPGGKRVVSDGEVVAVSINRGKGRSIHSVSASFALSGDLRFTFRREGVHDRIAKSLGIVRELQTSDVPFDGRIYIESEDPALHEALSHRPSLRNRIFELMRDNSVYEVGAMHGRLWLRSRSYDDRPRDEDAFLRLRIVTAFLPSVRELRTELASIGDGGTEESRDHTRVVRRWVSAAVVLCVAAGAVGLFLEHALLNKQVVLEAIPRGALLIAGAVFAAFALVLFTLLRSTAFTHRVLFDILLAAVPCAWVAATGGLMNYNQRYDETGATRVTVPVARIYSEKQKKRVTWHLEVKSWPDSRGKHHFELSEYEHGFVVNRPCVDVLWRRGRLGDGWVERLEPSDAVSCEFTVE